MGLEEDVAALKLAASEPLAYVSQTTLGFALIEPIIVALQWRFSGGAESIRYMTQNRRRRVRRNVKFRLPSEFVGA